MNVELGDISLHYEEIIPDNIRRDDIVVLYLHEALGSIGQWKDFPQKVCAKLGLIGMVYERQGHGGSSPLTYKRTNTYLHDYALIELPVFIKKVIPADKRIILIGHSDGGTIAMLYASRYPEQIAGVITMAAHVINEPETKAGIGPAVKAYNEGKLKGLVKYHGEKTKDLFFAWADIWRSDAFSDWNITKEISCGDIPGLFIQGADDQYGTPKQIKLIEQHFGTNIRAVLLPNCGHHPHLEQKDEVIELIREWYNDNDSYL